MLQRLAVLWAAGVAAQPIRADGGERRLQQPSAPEPAICVQLAASGRLRCASDAGECPEACAAVITPWATACTGSEGYTQANAALGGGLDVFAGKCAGGH